jgi:hypothetical protein
MFELPLCAAKTYGKPPPESQKRILKQMDWQASKAKTTRV